MSDGINPRVNSDGTSLITLCVVAKKNHVLELPKYFVNKLFIDFLNSTFDKIIGCRDG